MRAPIRPTSRQARLLGGLVLVHLFVPCGPIQAQENILVLVADDVGVDRIGCYAEHPDPGRTPNIDRLARSGVLFRNAWSSPRCSPSRANVLTGRYGFRTGIGDIVTARDTVDLDPAEWILPEVLAFSPFGSYENAALGKWHLGNAASGPTHALQTGFRRHLGAERNIGDYQVWPKNFNGSVQNVNAYATTDLIDDTLRSIEALPEPWFLWVAFNASHTPFHAPPDHLHSQGLHGPPDESPVTHMKAATEAMDTEIGRLLAGVDPDVLANTTIFFLGENGTHPAATDGPFDPDHAKGTLFEGGVNVPLIVAGPRVAEPGSECGALVALTDIFLTVAEIGGVDAPSLLPPGTVLDSTSLLPYLAEPDSPSLRDWVYAERFYPNGPGQPMYHLRAVRGPRYKLIRQRTVTDEVEFLFDLEQDPWEQNDLLQQPVDAATRQVYLDLCAVIANLSGS
jgi:arylsulfatase A-like enzyme